MVVAAFYLVLFHFLLVHVYCTDLLVITEMLTVAGVKVPIDQGKIKTSIKLKIFHLNLQLIFRDLNMYDSDLSSWQFCS